MKRALLIVAILSAATLLISQPEPAVRVGPLPGGGILLPTGWVVRPAGRQLPLDTFPMNSLLTPDGRFLLVLHGGYNPPSLHVIDAKTEKPVSQLRLPDAWLGMAITTNGRLIYVSGGSQSAIYEVALSPEGRLELRRTFEVTPQAKRTNRDFIGDVALTPDNRLIYAADLYHDQIVVINPQSGRVIDRWKSGRRPYRILFHPDGQSYFVTSWTAGTLEQYMTSDGHRTGLIRLGPHTTDMVWRDKPTVIEQTSEEKEEEEEARKKSFPYKARIFVTASNTNRVFTVGITESKEMRLIESINVAMTPRQPLGMTPAALALNADQSRLWIVCSDANAVAVADVRTPRSRVLGFVPSGWYPTAVRVLPDGRAVILNGRGERSHPNPKGPQPNQRTQRDHEGIRTDQYIATMQRGSASFVDPVDDASLEAHTQVVFENSPYDDRLLDELNIPAGNPVPSRPGGPSPIEHVVYIVKENRTYDQVLGDLGRGNGDPSLVLFPERVSPNHHKLAREFVLLDNFYVSADVSADGHAWTTSAIANDYIQKLWPNSYASRRRLYDYEGQEPTAAPPAGYIWTQVLSAGLSMRNYGYFGDFIPLSKVAAGGNHVSGVRDPRLAPVTNMRFRGFDMDYPDVDRAKVFLDDLKQFEAQGNMPRFIIMRLGNDHTSGTTAGKIAPLSAMADNDYALGMIVEALSRSKFWPKTAVFVIQDDAQNGPDHVDSHRAPAYVLSPYTRRAGTIDSTFYNTTSMLRTMELILGLRPMTTFDAASPPMWSAFAEKPDSTPYTAEKPRIPLDERNPATSATAARSAALDFSEADLIDDNELNEILWRAIKGTEPPAPSRSYFSARLTTRPAVPASSGDTRR
jgi:DNA-binding beta-propeller fold protein YncE